MKVDRTKAREIGHPHESETIALTKVRQSENIIRTMQMKFLAFEGDRLKYLVAPFPFWLVFVSRLKLIVVMSVMD